jgi:hypothetical protein
MGMNMISKSWKCMGEITSRFSDVVMIPISWKLLYR